FPSLGRGSRKRFLAKNVLAALGGFARPFAVKVIGQGNVDGVDVRVVEHRFIAAMSDGNASRVRRGLGFVFRSAGNGAQFRIDGAAKARNEPFVDLRNAQDAPTKFHDAPSGYSHLSVV